MSVEQNKETFRRWIEEGWNRGDLSVVDQLYAPAYVSHSFPPDFAPDREGLKQFVTAYRTAFPDLRFTLDDVVGEGEKVIARFTGTGTHREAFMGIAATGKPIAVGGFLQARFESGKWTEELGELGSTRDAAAAGRRADTGWVTRRSRTGTGTIPKTGPTGTLMAFRGN